MACNLPCRWQTTVGGRGVGGGMQAWDTIGVGCRAKCINCVDTTKNPRSGDHASCIHT